MGVAKFMRALWTRPKKNLSELWRARLIRFRKESVTTKLDKPTRIDRARALGYKAKKGIFVVRQRVLRGGHFRERKKGKRSKKVTKRMILHKNYKQIAEERVSKKFTNSEVLNSYWVAEDGKHYWYEVIMVDRTHPQITSDKKLSWVKTAKGRAHRGKTSAGRKARGLRSKGRGAEKARPSRRAHKRKQ